MNSAQFPTEECFALLDDSSQEGQSRLYTGYAGKFACDDPNEFPALLERLQAELRQGKHAVGLFAYELGAASHGISPHADVGDLAQILLFDRCDFLSGTQLDEWLSAHTDGSSAGVANLRSNVTQTQFGEAIVRIREYLEAGDTYQVNYTYRLRFDAYGSLFALYAKLRAGQPAPYGALIALPDGSAVLSRSPELFVRNEGGELTAQPMKGTAAVGSEAEKTHLANDPKNRAENLMIVDLLRNDLGRIAQLGTVRVPKLFEVTRFGNVLQMTSTVQARMRDDLALADVIAAIYPCGSVTGAPKRRTMQIIRELEPEPRGIYTGAIGWFEAPLAERKVGDFCLSVPIRTLSLQAPKDGLRQGEMGVGAGIVHDSDAQQEFDECRLKASFLTGLRHDFELIETMHATVAGCRHLDRHLRRLQASAAYFGFRCEEAYLRESVQSACAQLSPDAAHRLRLSLNQDGLTTIQTAPISAPQEPVKLIWARETTRSGDLFLRHKTTVRATYDAAWKEAEAQGAFDMLFCNERGEVTEGARSNLFIKLRGRWLTPPLAAGILPGVMRAVLLNDAAWAACEQSMSRQDVQEAEEIVICNSLRGVLRARLEEGKT